MSLPKSDASFGTFYDAYWHKIIMLGNKRTMHVCNL